MFKQPKNTTTVTYNYLFSLCPLCLLNMLHKLNTLCMFVVQTNPIYSHLQIRNLIIDNL